MPEEKSVTQTNPDIDTVNSVTKQNTQVEQQKQQQQAGIGPDELVFYIQQAMEQVKFELKNEIVQALNAKAQQFSDTDPTTSTSLKASAGAINEAVSDVVPLGENEEFNQQQVAQQQAMAGQQQKQQPSQQQVKQASEIVWDTFMKKLDEYGYFEKNASAKKETINQDLIDIAKILGVGMDKYAEDNDVDFSDPNYHDVLKELVMDNTLYKIGIQEMENE